MMNITPIRRRILRILDGRIKTYQEMSEKHWILCPSESSTSPPAIYLDKELQKVTAVLKETSYDLEMERIGGVRREHAATIAYSIRDVQILDGYVYKGAMKHALVTTKEPLFGQSVTDYLPKAALACTWCGNRYFGHWMTDDITLNLAAQQLAEAITSAKKPYSHEPEYRRLFGIQARTVTRVKCGELIIINDFGQNRFKRERYEFLRDRLRLLEPVQKSHGIMIRRGGKLGVQRVLTNEAEIEQFLETQGFTIIDPEGLSATEIVRQALDAKVVVGIEGSHIVHGLFSMADSGTLCILQPPYRFNNVFKDYTDCLGMRYAFVVGKSVPNGFMIELEDLARTLNRIQTLIA